MFASSCKRSRPVLCNLLRLKSLTRSSEESFIVSISRIIHGKRGYCPNPRNAVDVTVNTKGEVGKLFREEKNLRPFSSLPGPGQWDIINKLPLYTSRMFDARFFHNYLLDLYKKYGPIFKAYISGQPSVHLFSPEMAQEVYQQEGKWPEIPPLLEASKEYRLLRDISIGLGNMNGEDWSRVRRAAQGVMMKPTAVVVFLPHVDEVAVDLVKYIDAIKNEVTHEVSDVQRVIKLWNFESATLTCFEERMGALDHRSGCPDWISDTIEANEALFDMGLKLKFSYPWHQIFPTKTWKVLVKAEDRFYQRGLNMLDNAIKRFEGLQNSCGVPDGRYAMLTHMLQQKNWTDSEMSVTILTVLADGLIATVNAVTFLLYSLATNPAVQQKLYEEIRNVSPETDKPLEASVLKNMKYFRACLKETFRLFPNGPDVARFALKNTSIAGYQIKEGCPVYIHTNLMLRFPKYFRDPDDFVPERWLKGHPKEANVHPFLLTPFSFGPRMCIGRRIAEQEIAVLTLRVLQNFRLTWAGSEPLSQHYRIIMEPSTQLSLRFIPRI